nr:class I tRNA ligase family protein [Candidatus Woesebacteria bacterium]
YQNRIGTCYRCGRVLEPLPLPQFFISVNKPGKSMTQSALAALDAGETIVHGAGREKILRHWLENLKDWNISRQVVWGIRIPVWYEVSGNETRITLSFITTQKEFVQGQLSELLKTYPLDEIERGLQQLFAETDVPYSISVTRPGDEKKYLPETDTFDTWFSSAQWPVVTLKTNKPDDFNTFYPTTLMETGYDILPFWVMRMMLMGIYLTGKTPFKEVYLHGLVRDSKGQKMSKSKGNVINPLEVVDQYGADALRMALVIRSTPGQDKSVSDQDFKAMRNFSNKIWNAARFIQMQKENLLEDTPTGIDTTNNDAEYMKKLEDIITAVTEHMQTRRIGLAADVLYNEFWHWFCDECIEKQKKGELSLSVLEFGCETFLKLLHPFMPFVTEKIWQEIESNNDNSPSLLITSAWPTVKSAATPRS